MRHLVLVIYLVAAVYGRPEAGYSYPQPSPAPSGSYGVPSGATVLNGISSGSYVIPSALPSPVSFVSSSSFPSGGASYVSSGASSAGLGFASSGAPGGVNFVSSGIPSSGVSFVSSGAPQGINFGAPSGGVSFAGAGSQGASFSSSGTGFADGGVAFGGGGATLIQKHIYVHVPPPETEEFRPRRPLTVAAPQKHYKIIFIKAPTAPTPTVPVIPLQPQNEEKTLVYVLVKRPEEGPEITIPTAAPTQPSKPEVYFIRYRTQKDTVALGGGVGGVSDGIAVAGGDSSITSGFVDNADTVLVGSKGGSSGSLGVVGQNDLGGAGLGSGSVSGGVSVLPTTSTSGVSSTYGPPGHQAGPY